MKADTQIKQDVLAELEWDPEVDISKVGVVVEDGAVTLSGHIATYRQKVTARDAVKRVDGVHAIVNNMDVQLPSQHRMSDEGLAERISHVLAWNVSSVGHDIKAEVRNGTVTLTGEVEWGYQQRNLMQNIQHVSGVVHVVNSTTIKPSVSAADVKHKIKSALQRHADVEGDKITVTTTGGTVKLAGSVESFAQQDLIDNAAWSAPGVSQVVDQLRIVRNPPRPRGG